MALQLLRGRQQFCWSILHWPIYPGWPLGDSQPQRITGRDNAGMTEGSLLYVMLNEDKHLFFSSNIWHIDETSLKYENTPQNETAAKPT